MTEYKTLSEIAARISPISREGPNVLADAGPLHLELLHSDIIASMLRHELAIAPDSQSLLTVEYLRGRGIFVTAVVHPVVPLGLCMFRMIPTAAHVDEDIAETVAAFAAMRDDLSLDLSFNDGETANLKKIYGDLA